MFDYRVIEKKLLAEIEAENRTIEINNNTENKEIQKMAKESIDKIQDLQELQDLKVKLLAIL